MKKFIYNLIFVFLILFSFNNIFATDTSIGDSWGVDVEVPDIPDIPVIPDFPSIEVPRVPNNGNVSDSDLLNNWFIVENSETQTTMLYTSNDSFHVVYNENTPDYPYLVVGFNSEADWLLYKCYTYDWDTETWIFSGTSSQVYVCSNTVDNPISNITLCNCNIFNEDKMTIFRESGFDYVVTNDNSRIKIWPEFSEGFVTCKIDAEIENKQEGEVLYYDDYTSNSTVGDTKKIFPIGTGITITENKSINFYLYDATGNLIDTNSVSIYRLVGFNSDLLKLDFDTAGGNLKFKAILDNNSSGFYDVYLCISDINKLKLKDINSSTTKNIVENYTNFNKIEVDNNYLLQLNDMVWNTKTVDLSFRVIDRNSKRVVLTKKYNVTLGGLGNSTINKGEIIDYTGKNENMTPDNDSNISSIGSIGNLNENSNLNDILNFAKESFNTFKLAFDVLPSFIWSFISITLVVLFVLRIFGR